MIPILLENDDILAVHKPEHLASIPERTEGKECLVSLLSSMFKGKLYVVHRLDKEVSGVILLAKNAATHRYLNDQFAHRQVRKTYVLMTHGVIDRDRGMTDRAIRPFGSGRMGIDEQRGKASVTESS